MVGSSSCKAIFCFIKYRAMMSCKLVSIYIVLYCCFQLPFLQAILCASISGHRNSTASCSSAFMQCGSSLNISYPFWGSAPCAASPSYFLANCSTSSSSAADWDSFSSAANGVVGAPVVTAINSLSQARKSVLLSWNKTLIDLGYCAPPFPSTDLALYNIPSSIDITRFPDSSALKFSLTNTYLLFNCTHNTTDVLAQFGSHSFQAESASGCRPYKGFCPSMANTPCIQWLLHSSMKKLMLQQVLDSLACSHFMFGTGSIDHYDWSTGSIRLTWTDIKCQTCLRNSGNCIYDVTVLGKFDHCNCKNGFAMLSFNACACDTGSPQCNIGARIALALLLLGVLLVIVVNCFCIDLCGMIKESIRVGVLNFIKLTMPIAINVLNKTQRKLQSSSTGHNISLDTIDFDGLTERPIEYSYSSISSATKSFGILLGEGGFGTVYKGTLTPANNHGGLELQIAVKVLDVRSKHCKKQFLNEVVTIGRTHHVNVVRLLGFCMQEDHKMLVYEYVVNGSLDRWLFKKKEKPQEQVLDWGQRYTIALGIARGLSYLHEECRHRTVHCDIKPQNILLDENMHPKIADFGLARLMGRDESKVLTLPKGTPGYMAPEFWMGGESQLSTKSDVYSYGMVLLELISGQRNFRCDTTTASHASSFPVVAFKAVMEGDLESILDARLGITRDGDEVQWHQIKTAAFVALWCIQDHPANRPGMSEVVKYLEGGAAVSECPPQPTISISSTVSPPQIFPKREYSFLPSVCSEQLAPSARGLANILNENKKL